MTDEIMVSVLCLAYNHEKYIRKCLDGFVMQKTNFRFEVIIHDDASTDKTAEIIREYEEKYPNIIKPIYQTENQFSKGIKITGQILLPKAKGKYIALCEGDDFWTSPYKLQKQVDALESNKDCCIALHKVRAISKDGAEEKHTYPSFEINKTVIPQEEFLKIVCKGYNFQTSSFMFKADEYIKYQRNKPEFAKICPIGDVPTLMYFASFSDACYINEEMSKYRLVSQGSWNERQNISAEFRVKHYRLMNQTVEKFEAFTDHKYPQCYSDLYHRWYSMLWLNRDFKEVLNKHYREFFKQESFKDRMYVRASVYCPFIAKLYNKIRHSE